MIKPTKIIAHRGFWKTEGSAQNSIFALKKAAEFGFDGTEFDVHLTKDEVLIVYHDDEINGVLIENSYYRDIANFKLLNHERIPTLAAYLEAAKNYPNLCLVIEIKSQNNHNHEEKIIKRLLQLIKDKMIENQLEFISFSKTICTLLKKENSNLKVSYLEGDLSPKEIKALGLDGLDYDFEILLKNKHWIKEAHQLGLRTNSWTVNDQKYMKELIDLNIDLISTDEPILLYNMLNRDVAK